MVRDLDAEELRAPWTLTAEELKRAAGKRDANALAFAVLARVLSGPEAAGCLKVYKDTATGTKAARPQWIRCLDDLRTGDTLIIWKIDRLDREPARPDRHHHHPGNPRRRRAVLDQRHHRHHHRPRQTRLRHIRPDGRKRSRTHPRSAPRPASPPPAASPPMTIYRHIHTDRHAKPTDEPS